MSKKEKLVKRLKSKPTDFTWSELAGLLIQLGFKEIQGSGSRVKFYHERLDFLIKVHKPHPAKIIKHYVIREVTEILNRKRLI